MHPFFSPKSFAFQLVLFFILFTLGVSVSIGIPAAIMLSRQNQNQQQALADQASQTTLALFKSQQTQLQNLAFLLMNRPTLQQLRQMPDNTQTLSDYLETFRQDSEVDALVICEGEAVNAAAGMDALTSGGLCAGPSADAIHILHGEAWLTAAASSDDAAVTLYIANELSGILTGFSPQSGLDYLLYDQNQLLVSSLSPGSTLPETIQPYETLALVGDEPTHMAAVIPLTDQPDVTLVGLLNIENVLRLNRQMRLTAFSTLLGVSLVGALVAVLFSRRISQPLHRLAQAAVRLRSGDLGTPLPPAAAVWEVDQLTNALEDARISLKHSLDQLKREKAWIENLLNAIVEGLISLDERGCITFASKAVERMMGTGSEAWIGRKVDEVFPTPAGEEPFSRQIPDAGLNRRIPVLMNEGVHLLTVSSSSFVPPEAGNANRALVLRDVTNEDRIHRLMGEFMANITHEFRTPLSALSASVELLMDQLAELETSEVEELLNALNIGIIHLQSLIDNTIEAASIEAGRFKVNPRPTPFNTILDEAVNTVQPIIKKHGLTLHLPQNKPTLPVMADQRRTCQVLVNLLSNAIKHSPPGGRITLTTLVLGQALLIEVADEGEGISSSQAPHLFNRFILPSQEDRASQMGLGLGLSVVKAIVEAQKGEVGFKNRETGGALFWFTLPLASRIET